VTDGGIVLRRGHAARLRAGWFAVAILMVAYAISFVDRQIVNLLVEPLKRDLDIIDSQVGLLQGVGFGIFYTLLGLPLGWLADRTHRVRLIAFGIALWSLMTMACGLAGSFGELFVARMGVGVGEAALVPAAVSLLADIFDPHERALPLSIFTAGVSVGSGLALALGGAVIVYASGGAADLPLVGPWLAGLHPWQTTFILVGFIGLPIAASVLLIAEPARRSPPDADPVARPVEQLGGIVAHLRTHWRLFVPLLLGVGLLYILANADSSWIPSIFIRGFDWKPADVGRVLGIPIMACAMTGTFLAGGVATWLARRAPSAAALRTMTIGALFFLVPIATVAPLAPTALLAGIGVVLMFGATALTFGAATTAIVGVTPNRLRGQATAIYLLVGNLFGLGLGPYSVGALLDFVLGNPRRVGEALAIVAVAAGLPGALLLRAVRPTYIAVRARVGES
jgi:MFS family permease